MCSLFKKALFTCALVLASGATALAANDTLTIVSAPFGKTGYVMGSAIEDIIKKSGSGIKITQEEGYGMFYNLKKLHTADADARKTMIIMGTLTSMWQAQNGKPPFKEPIATDMRVLFSMYDSDSCFMSRDPKIKSVPDLVGKTVAIGKKSQDVYGTFLFDHIDAGYGLADKINVQWVGNASALSSFKDGLSDAAGADILSNPATGEVAAGPAAIEVQASYDKVNWFGSSKEALDNVLKTTGIPYTIVKVPAGTFEGQTEEFLTLGTPNFWGASLDMPEEVAYQFVSTIIKNVDQFQTYHSAGKLITKEALCYGFTKDQLHPGAYRAFKEAGLMD